jgi:hypothetical protein
MAAFPPKPFNGHTVVISDNPQQEYVVEVYSGPADMTNGGTIDNSDPDNPTFTPTPATRVAQVKFTVNQYDEYRRYVIGMLNFQS